MPFLLNNRNMPGKTRIKLIRSLKDKKNRNRHGLFIVEGDKTVKELLLSDWKVHSLYATEEWLKENPVKGDFDVFPVNESTLRRISLLKTPNHVLALSHLKEADPGKISCHGNLTLVLDNVQDPGNLGTLVRVCDWFGIRYIICSENCADIYNPKVVQSAMGSIFRVKVGYTCLKRFFSSPQNKKIPVYGAFLDEESIYSHTLGKSGFILLGNESRGISPAISGMVDFRITIPSAAYSGDSSESLNVAVAGGIIISEFRRKHFFGQDDG